MNSRRRFLCCVALLTISNGNFWLQPSQAAKDKANRALGTIRLAAAVPGKRIGKAKLGMSRSAMRKTLGKPSTSFRLSSHLESDLWRTMYTPGYRDSPNTLEVIYRNNKAIQIEATSAAFKTDKGISTATPVHLVRKVHPKMNLTKLVYERGDQKRQHYYDDIWQGIAFEYWPDQDEINTLIVHQTGVGVTVDPDGKPENH